MKASKDEQILIIGDSSSMPEIDSESIHLVVTSPPYWNLKKYGEEGLGQIKLMQNTCMKFKEFSKR